MREKYEEIHVLNVSESAHGGLSSFFNVLAGHLSSGTVPLFLIPDRHDFMLDAELARRNFRHTGRNPATIFRMIANLQRLMRSTTPDLVVFHSFFAIPALLYLRVLCPSVPRVYIPHGWTTWQFRRSSAGEKLAEFCERIACRFATRTISLCAAELAFAKATRLPGRHVFIRLAVPEPAPTKGSSRITTDMNEIRLLYVGRLDHQKGVDLLLEAFGQALEVNPALRLTLIGSAARSGRAVKAAAERHGGSGLTFQGWKSRVEIGIHYAEADALMVPSRWEGFGMVVGEAAWFGTPAIVSDRGGLPEHVSDGINGYIFHLSEDEDIGPLTRLLSHLSRPELRAMREEVRSRVANGRSAKEMATEFEQLFRELVEEARAKT